MSDFEPVDGAEGRPEDGGELSLWNHQNTIARLLDFDELVTTLHCSGARVPGNNRSEMRRIVVTGANKGIGLAIVEAILDGHDDTFVYLGARSAARGASARDSLVRKNAAWSARVEVLAIDVASDDSVGAAAAQVASGGPLYGVVNNAGVGAGSLRDILEVNTFGVRRTCEAFVPVLGAKGRIVIISSASGPSFVATRDSGQRDVLVSPDSWAAVATYIVGCLAQDDQDGTFTAQGAMGGGGAYGLSKALANAYTVVLAREQPGLRVNACTPGFIETDLTRPFAQMSGQSPEAMGMKAPAAGTRSTMFLLFGEPEGNGRYYGSDAVRSPLDRYRGPGEPAYTGKD
jgi:carbonyl reductase 1